MIQAAWSLGFYTFSQPYTIDGYMCAHTRLYKLLFWENCVYFALGKNQKWYLLLARSVTKQFMRLISWVLLHTKWDLLFHKSAALAKDGLAPKL